MIDYPGDHDIAVQNDITVIPRCRCGLDRHARIIHRSMGLDSNYQVIQFLLTSNYIMCGASDSQVPKIIRWLCTEPDIEPAPDSHSFPCLSRFDLGGGGLRFGLAIFSFLFRRGDEEIRAAAIPPFGCPFLFLSYMFESQLFPRDM